MMHHRSWRGGVALGAISLIGVAALLGPFLLAAASSAGGHSASAPLIFALVMVGLLGLLLAESGGGQLNARVVATLAALTAINAVLRLPTGPADSPTFFFLVILAGYVLGGQLGFLLGALSLLVSAVLTAGVGPWLPFQMLAMGWMGLSAAGLPALARLLRLPEGGRGELWLLAAFGWLWGFGFGLVMNLTFWPFAALGPEIGWEPGIGLAETLRRYRAFYLLTSLAWDANRALSNLVLILIFGRPLLRILRRFRARFWWQDASTQFAMLAPEALSEGGFHDSRT